MNITILYATYSSGTEAVAHHIEEAAKKGQIKVSVKRIHDAIEQDVHNADLVILGSPSWERDGGKFNGQPHHDYFSFFRLFGYDATLDPEVRTATKKVMGQSFAVFGLGDTTYPHFCGAVDCLEDFVHEIGGKLIVPSLRINDYQFHIAENNRVIEQWVKLFLK